MESSGSLEKVNVLRQASGHELKEVSKKITEQLFFTIPLSEIIQEFGSQFSSVNQSFTGAGTGSQVLNSQIKSRRC